MINIEFAAQIAEFKYPSDKHTIDQSSYHRAFAEDALDAKVMNARPGGVQPQIHDTMWAGKRWNTQGYEANPRGGRYNTTRMVRSRGHDNFRNEKTIIEQVLRR